MPNAQEAARDAVYLELGGPGLIYAFNYEHRFGRLAVRAGLGYDRFHDGSVLALPLSATVLLGSNSPYSAFEIGAGFAILRVSSSSDVLGLHNGFAIPMPIIGGRHQSRDGRLLLRGGFGPVLLGGLFLPLPYLAAGLTF